MRRKACARCAATDDLDGATITDESGGAFVRLCENCRTLIDTPRCNVCGDRKTGRHKADALFFEDDYGTALEICDDCRIDLVFAPQRVTIDG